MTPTLRDGDRVLVRRGRPVRAGDVVLATFAAMPDRFVIKRVASQVDGGWWLTSDNGFAGGDSDSHGVAAVHARAVLRIPTGGGWPRRVR